MAILDFSLNEEGVASLRDALICLNKFSDDVSLEARKDSFVLSTLNSSKSAYASFKFATNKFFFRYNYQASGQYREKFYCTLYIRALISLFRSRSAGEIQRDGEKQTLIDRCDVAIEDGEGIQSRFISRIVFRNGLTSTHKLPFEASVPVHAKFSRQDSPHHWSIASRTLRQLMDHFGPGIDYLDINTDGDHVNFTCFSEKTVSEDAVLRKPLQTSIAVEADEFDEIDVEDKLHIVISVKDFRSIIQHAGIAGSDLCARYSLPSKPIQFSYAADAMVCEFLIMTVGERGSQPNQKVKKGQKSTAQAAAPRLEAVSRRTSVAPSEAPQQQQQPQQKPPPELAQAWTPSASARPQASGVPRPAAAVRAGASRMSAFDLRPSQKPPPPTLRSESLFVEDEGWEPVQDEDEDADEGARLGWDHSADPDPNPSFMHLSRPEETRMSGPEKSRRPAPEPTFLEPTQKLSDVRGLGLFDD